MPNTSAAKKALRQTKKKTVLNIVRKKHVKETLKSASAAIEAQAENVQELVQKATKALDKAAKKNTMHPNKAGRLKASLQKKLNATKK